MDFVRATDYRPDHAWDAIDVAEFSGDTTVRLHWSDQPYVWHVNDGPEVFVVLAGAIDMHHRSDGQTSVTRLEPGDICHAQPGDEHVAVPQPDARMLVVERKGSV